MDLLLIRHALPVRVERVDGPADPPLSDVGHQQSRLLADYLKTEQLDALYCSPLTRARETAQPLAEAQQLPIAVEDGVAEYDRMSDTYIPVEELKAADDPRWHAMLAGERLPGEEEIESFAFRAVEAIERLIDANAGRKIAVVCHGGVVNVYLAHVLGITGPAFFYPNYTSIHRVAASSGGIRSIVTMNETAHLRGSGLVTGLHD